MSAASPSVPIRHTSDLDWIPVASAPDTDSGPDAGSSPWLGWWGTRESIPDSGCWQNSAKPVSRSSVRHSRIRAPAGASWRRLARDLGVGHLVRFLTAVPDEDLPALYNCAEIYLGLSRGEGLLMEGFGISLVEASACGIPVVGARQGGIPDAVREGETGLLVDSTDLPAIVDAVQSLLQNQEIGEAIRPRRGEGQWRPTITGIG